MRTGNCLSHRRRQGEDVGWLVAGKQGDMIGVSRLFLFINADSQAVRYCSKKITYNICRYFKFDRLSIPADYQYFGSHRLSSDMAIIFRYSCIPVVKIERDMLCLLWKHAARINIAIIIISDQSNIGSVKYRFLLSIFQINYSIDDTDYQLSHGLSWEWNKSASDQPRPTKSAWLWPLVMSAAGCGMHCSSCFYDWAKKGSLTCKAIWVLLLAPGRAAILSGSHITKYNSFYWMTKVTLWRCDVVF
jgi:hypothetical protein